MPRRFRRDPVKVNVIVYALATGNVERRNRINLDDPQDVRRLQRLLLWACLSRHSVEIINKADR